MFTTLLICNFWILCGLMAGDLDGAWHSKKGLGIDFSAKVSGLLFFAMGPLGLISILLADYLS